MISTRTCIGALLSALLAACSGEATTPTPAPQVTAFPTQTPAAPVIEPTATLNQVTSSEQTAMCVELAGLLAQKLGLTFTPAAALPSDPMQSGTALPGCTVNASGSGTSFDNPLGVYNALAAAMQEIGWQEDMRYQSGGPIGTGGAFRHGGQLCMTTVEWQPTTDANCPTNQPAESCELRPEQRVYTVWLECGQPKPVSGAVTLSADPNAPNQPAAYADLDAGMAGDMQGGDLVFVADGSPTTVMTLTPVNGATAYAAGERTPGQQDCHKALDDGAFTTSGIPEVSSGSYICVMTNRANLVLARVERVEQNTVELSFATLQ